MNNNLYTGGIPTGYWMEANSEEVISAYILGVSDGMFASRRNLDDPICRDNPNMNRENVVEMVRQYYVQSPENRFRQIAAVIRSGCK